MWSGLRTGRNGGEEWNVLIKADLCGQASGQGEMEEKRVSRAESINQDPAGVEED